MLAPRYSHSLEEKEDLGRFVYLKFFPRFSNHSCYVPGATFFPKPFTLGFSELHRQKLHRPVHDDEGLLWCHAVQNVILGNVLMNCSYNMRFPCFDLINGIVYIVL